MVPSNRIGVCLLLSLLMMSATGAVDFERDVRPILADHCFECHAGDESSGGLKLDQPAGATVETDSGKAAIVPGHPEQSELIARITSADEDERMPPEGGRLSDKQIETLRDWIGSGAARPMKANNTEDSNTENSAEVSEHWAFQPLTEPERPMVQDESWARNEIDDFIQHRRELEGLSPAEDASPTTMVRRLHFGLTGLPPTPAEVDNFVKQATTDSLPVAIRDRVEELLSRPSYGERWGRHWMDWVRYADTAGDNSDYPIPQAYLYRNYIIDSFNRDVPYDQFLTEQIAGDLLPYQSQEQRNRQVIATGYLAMARRFGSLVERYPWHLTIEDTIDNVGRTMMGLTLSCARCHDHKFDPITTRDYYGLYGIFASTRYPFPGIELFKAQRDFVSLLSDQETQSILGPSQPTTEKLIAELNDHLAKCEQKAEENARREKDSSVDEQRRMRDELDGMLLKARRAGERLADHLRKVPEIPTAYAVVDSDPTDAAIQIKGEPTRPGAVVPRGFPKVLGGWKLAPETAESSSGRLQLAHWIAAPSNPLTARVIVNRIWQRHFGSGIVPSTSDFGHRGQTPSHPELLDHLANELIASGWSIKHLHRKILTSRTYALASTGDRRALASDPANTLYWRFNRQRLDAESLRDSMLMISGQLDPKPQSEPFPFPSRDQWGFTQHHPFKDSYDSNKRSVYLMTKRLTAQPYFQTFDGPDPNVCTSDRDQSITALQALFFVNDDFVHQQSERFAKEVLRSSTDPTERISYAIRHILCRDADAEELLLMRQHVDSVVDRLGKTDRAETLAYASLVRSLFRLNEFLYLD